MSANAIMTAWQCGGQGFESPQLHRPATGAIEATADGDAAVLAGWASDDTRLRIEAALAALARR